MVKSIRSVPGTLLVFADFEAQAKMLIWKERAAVKLVASSDDSQMKQLARLSAARLSLLCARSSPPTAFT